MSLSVTLYAIRNYFPTQDSSTRHLFVSRKGRGACECVPVHSLSSRPGWGTPEVAYELGVSALNLVQVYPQIQNVLSAIEQLCVN
jgi:hypothetical protein